MLPSFRRQCLGGNRCVDFTGGALQSPGGVYSSSALTICMWFQQTTTPADYALSVLTTFGASYTGLAAAFGNDLAVWGNGSTFGVLFGSLNLNQWYWAAMIADGVNTRAIGTIGLRGAFGQVSSGATSGNAADVLVVGGDSNGAGATSSGNWPGVIAGYKAFSTVMSNEELFLERTQLAPVSQRHLVDYLPLKNAGSAGLDEVRNAPGFWTPQTASTFKSQNLAPPVPEVARQKVMSFLSRPAPATTTFLGVFDPTAVNVGWFDPTTQGMGWFAQELLQPLSVPFFFGGGTFPDYIPRPRRSMPDQPAFVPVVVAAATPTQAPSIFPDAVAAPRRIDPMVEHAALVQLVIAAATPTQFPSVFPDSVPRAKPAQQAGQASIVIQEQTVAISAVDFPNIVRRPFFPPSEQLAVTELPPQPERVVSIADVEFPDRIPRPTFHTEEQLVITELPPQPERTAPMATAIHPDAVIRPKFPTADQQASNVVPPQPERVAQLADVEFPDRVPRPFFHAEDQLTSTELSPQPERVAPQADVEFPDRVPRPTFHTEDQLAVTEVSPQPERVAPLAVVEFPERVPRPKERVVDQPFVTGLPPQPERVTSIADVEFPDRIPRAASVAAASQEAVTELPPSPERTAPLASVYHPDTVRRPVYSVTEQLAATELPPQPERTSSLAQTYFPDRVPRPFVPTSEQPFVTGLSPFPERTTPLACVVYPDALPPRRLPQGDYQADAIAPFQPPVVIVVQPAVSFPDRIPHIPIEPQREHAEPIAPERKIPATDPVFPHAITRPFFRPENQKVEVDVGRPERTAPLASIYHPDRIPRPSVPVANQQAEVDVGRPERTMQLASVYHPDRIPRPLVPVANQQAEVDVGRPEQTTALDWESFFPERVPRPKFPPEDQLAFALGIPNIAPIYAAAEFPDFVHRPELLTALRQSMLALVPILEQTTALDWEAFFPERVDRPKFPAGEQQAFVVPVITSKPLDWLPTYADWLPHLRESTFAFYADFTSQIPNPRSTPRGIPQVELGLSSQVEATTEATALVQLTLSSPSQSQGTAEVHGRSLSSAGASYQVSTLPLASKVVKTEDK